MAAAFQDVRVCEGPGENRSAPHQVFGPKDDWLRLPHRQGEA